MSVRQSGRAMRSREARAPIGLVAPMPGHLDCELDAGGDVQLGEDMGEMGLHCPRGHIQAVTDLRIGEALGNQARDGVLGGGKAPPADLRPVAESPAAAADARAAQQRLGAGDVATCVEALVNLHGMFQERTASVGVALPGERRAGVLAGKSLLKRTEPVGVGLGRVQQNCGIILSQA
jgi:hypothetical protein